MLLTFSFPLNKWGAIMLIASRHSEDQIRLLGKVLRLVPATHNSSLWAVAIIMLKRRMKIPFQHSYSLDCEWRYNNPSPISWSWVGWIELLAKWMSVRSCIRHYWQNGGMVPSPLSSFHRHGSRDEGVRPCNSDLSFPLLSWVDWKGILRCLLFLRGAWEGTKPSAVVLRK